MTTQAKRLEFEQQLAQLKQACHNAEITINEYIEQAGNLRFDDEATGQTWWLDPESETWYVAAIGSENFEESPPSAGTETRPPEPEPEPEPREPEPEPTSPEPQVEAKPEPSPSRPAPKITPEPGPARVELKPSGELLGKKSKVVWIGAVIIIVIVTLLCVGAIGFSLLKGKLTPITIAMFDSPTSTPTPTPTLTPTPTNTPTPTPTPTPTNTPTPTPTMPTSSPTMTPSPTPSATNAPTLTNTPSSPPVANILTTTFTLTSTPGLSGKMAYPEFDNEKETFVIKVVDVPTGQVITQVPQASQPALSPNGKNLAYISWASDDIGVYHLSLADNIRNVISRLRDSQRPQWNFNNQNYVFEYIKGQEQKDIRFSDESEDGVRGIQKGQTPAWTPDSRLVVQACQGPECGLAVVNTNGADFKFLTHKTADISPAVSPLGGQWVAYTSEQEGNWDVWLVSIYGGTPRRLTTAPGLDGIPTWSPDEQWIAFASETGGQWSIQVIHPDGSEQQNLLDIAGNLDARINREADRQLGWLHESISWSK